MPLPAAGGGARRRCAASSTGAASACRCRDVLPMFERLGLTVTDERPYAVTPRDGAAGVDLRLRPAGARATVDADAIRERFQEGFARVWHGDAELDGFNGLIIAAGLDWREVTMLRAVARYLRQAGIPFSDRYMEHTLLAHPGVAGVARGAVPARASTRRATARGRASGGEEIEAAIDAVDSLDEDRILRGFLSRGAGDAAHELLRCPDPKPYVSFKLDPTQVPLMPLPRPRFEIFVYSPRVEGVHLRGGSVARGGLRWSDRREDFRTEILGLMKAQMVKNAVIVPVGAKGGFVVKRAGDDGRRVLHDVHQRPAGHHRQHRRRGRRAARARRAPRRRRSVPGGRGRQGHGDVLGHRQRGRGALRVLARRRVRLRRLGGLRPQGDGDHGARRRGCPCSATSASSASTCRPRTSRSSASAT